MRASTVKRLLLVGMLLVPLPGCSTDAPPRPQATGEPTPSGTARVERVSAYVCDVAYKPTQMLIACGDGNARVRDLQWRSWSARAASGTGTWEQNTCMPDCARGRFLAYAVSLLLSEPIHAQGTTIFGRVEAVFPKTAPPGARGHRELVMVDGHYAP